MANYTIEVRQLVDDYHIPLFDFEYPFYNQYPSDKEQFEALFIQTYYYHEIGFETVDRFKQRLQARLNLIMPYYQQLYLTQWEQVGKDMMNSKDLVETTTVKIQSDGTSSGSSKGSSKSDSSNLMDGVGVVNLDEENKTGTAQGESQSSSQSTAKNTQTETHTFTSKGDIGIQTPAYAIMEWRKVIININHQIIKDCHDLFMQIY